ncbi:MAG: hypothetical protein WC780_02860 [Lentimicrobiaceae bacterium]|jgi:hypothetical protein
MKKLKLIALLLTSIFVLSLKNSLAQNTTFKLSDYKNPDYFYQTLDLNFGLNSNLFGSRYSEAENYANNSLSLNSQAAAIYSRYLNSTNSQGEIHVAFNGGIGSGNSNSKDSNSSTLDESKNKSFNHAERIDIDGLHRFYNEKQNYIELNGSLYISNTHNLSNSKSYYSGAATASEETGQQNLDNILYGSILIGKGRIEQVQDARMALYLLDDLYGLKREKRSVSNQEVNELAQLITRLKYKRFFDNRLRKIAEITAIDSFMQQKGIVNVTDATYFTSLNDSWGYSNNPVRYSGHRIYTGLDANFRYIYNNEYLENILPDDLTNARTTKEKIAGLYLVLGYTYEKPTSRKWQNSAGIRGTIGYHQNSENRIIRNDPNPDTEENFYSEMFPSIGFNVDYGFGYYPSSRTWLTLNWWLSSGWDKVLGGDLREDKEDISNNFHTSTGPQINAYYYLSEKLRLSFSYNGQFTLLNYKYTSDIPIGSPNKATQKYWTQNISAALTYSLF